MKEHAKKAQQKWNIVVAIVSRIIFILGIAETGLPSCILKIGITANKVPVKVADVHMIDLIIQKEIQIAGVFSILLQVLGITRIAPREQHFLLPVDGSSFIIVGRPAEQGRITILFPSKVTDRRIDGFGIVFIDGGIGGRADEDKGVG